MGSLVKFAMINLFRNHPVWIFDIASVLGYLRGWGRYDKGYSKVWLDKKKAKFFFWLRKMHSNGICTLPCRHDWSKVCRQHSGCQLYLICSPLHQCGIPSFQHHQMHRQCWEFVIEKDKKWKFFCAFENLHAEWDTLNSFNFQPDKLLPRHVIMF